MTHNDPLWEIQGATGLEGMDTGITVLPACQVPALLASCLSRPFICIYLAHYRYPDQSVSVTLESPLTYEIPPTASPTNI